MKIKTFKVERWMNDYEDEAVYNLGETCIDSLTVGELLKLGGYDPAEYLTELADVRLTYSHIFGSPEFRKGVAELYENITPEQVLPTHGATGANAMVLETLLEPADNMISVMPTYQQHYSIPEAIGTEVRILQLTEENDYLPDIEELKRLTDKNTKMITVNNPNNPTGSWIPVEIMKQIAKVAEAAGAYLLCDEVYRGIAEDDSYMYSVTDLYDKAISVGSMSKIFSLAGLRMGWIATRDENALVEFAERRDYNTISCGVIDDKLASVALANKDKIFARNREILNTNRAILDRWVNETEGVHYKKPSAGTTALVYYGKDIPSYELCVRLIKEKGLLLTPGSCFETEGAVRIGYAFDSKLLKQGLDIFARFLKEELAGKGV